MASLPLRRLAATFLAAVAFLFLPLPARAEGEEGGPEESVEKKIQEQMQKIVRLMRDNEQKLLEAARSGGDKPPRVDLTPPEGGSSSAMAGEPSMGEPSMGEPSMGEPSMGEPSMGDPSMGEGGANPRERGDAIRRSLEELLEGVRRDGQQIPKEIEELIRMIPTQGGQSGSGQKPEGDPGSKPESEKREVADRKPEDGEKPKDAPDKPKDPAKRNEEKGGQKPPEGEKGGDAASEVPPWVVELPPEFRRAMTAADIEKVPEQYRALLERYLKWQADHPANRSGPK